MQELSSEPAFEMSTSHQREVPGQLDVGFDSFVITVYPH